MSLASRPPKAPATVAAEKNMEILKLISYLKYKSESMPIPQDLKIPYVPSVPQRQEVADARE